MAENTNPPFQFDDHSIHLYHLGQLMGNLSVFEMAVRIFLCKHHNEKWKPPKKGDKIVPETHMTNFNSLGEIVKKYNKISEEKYKIDPFVVRLRDGIAHGRIITMESMEIGIFKYAQPKNGNVEVVLDEVLNTDFYRKSLALVDEQILKVIDCGQQLGYSNTPAKKIE